MKVLLVVAFTCVFSFFQIASSHPLCSDGSTAVPLNNIAFCTDYKDNSCCSLARDAQIQQAYNGLGITNAACGQEMKRLLCGECDPWAAHLVGERDDKKPFPTLCTDYCGVVYGACSAVKMNKPPSPFPSDTINKDFPSKDAFCSQYGVVGAGYCYKGVPYEEEDVPVYNSSSGICIDRVVAAKPPNHWLAMSEINDGSKRVVLGARDGIIKVFQRTADGPWTDLGLALDLTGRVTVNGEGGLLGVAVHPNFVTNRKFYVSYVCSPAMHNDCKFPCTSPTQCLNGGTCTGGFCSNHDSMSIVDEYLMTTTTSNVAVNTVNKRILSYSQPGPNHNAGQVMFGPEGYLYVFFGDGGGNGHLAPQNPKNPLGKVLRLDVNTADDVPYQVPADNPFANPANNPQGWVPETFAIGFRNPWRNSFDRLTGALIMGDVGQDKIEEVNVVTKGKNYGWRKYEGYNDYTPVDPAIPGAVGPAIYYEHQWNGVSQACIIGGYVYRGSKDGCSYSNYIFGDLDGYLFSAFVESDGGIRPHKQISYVCGSTASTGISCKLNFNKINQIYSFGEDLEGNVYILSDQGVLSLIEPSRCPSLVCQTPPQTGITTGNVPTVPTSATAPATTGATTGATTAASTGATTATSATTGAATGATTSASTSASTTSESTTSNSDSNGETTLSSGESEFTQTISNDSTTDQSETSVVDSSEPSSSQSTNENTETNPLTSADSGNTTDGIIDDQQSNASNLVYGAVVLVAICLTFMY